MKKYLSIGKTAEILGVTITTLRRWDKNGRLKSTKMPSGHRRYSVEQIDSVVQKSIFSTALRWASSEQGSDPNESLYCPNSAVFQIRLMQMERELSRIRELDSTFSLIVAAVGEIGNNSFDHNLGNWPDISGIFFSYDIARKHIALADRGQGILNTLKKVRPKLKNHKDALKMAFTEIISGRAPEERGNGLKFVREAVSSAGLDLYFQTGDVFLKLDKKNSRIDIKKAKIHARGCFAFIKF